MRNTNKILKNDTILQKYYKYITKKVANTGKICYNENVIKRRGGNNGNINRYLRTNFYHIYIDSSSHYANKISWNESKRFLELY